MFIALIEGAGEGCDYTLDCNKTWKHLAAMKLEDVNAELDNIVEELGGHEMIHCVTVLEYVASMAYNAEAFIKEERVRGCSHAETDKKFCAECGAPMWVEN